MPTNSKVSQRLLSERLHIMHQWLQSRMHYGGGIAPGEAQEFSSRLRAAALDAEILELGINPQAVPETSALGVMRAEVAEPEGALVVPFPGKRVVRRVPINDGGAA
jgi:hypothetical protein